MDSENRHEFDATLDTFDHPRYELIATGEVYDGTEEVSGYYDDTRRAFPDQRNELLALHHADDAVLVEAVVRGTHKGPLAQPAADRPGVRAADPRDLRVRRRQADLRARLLRPDDGPAPARHRPRPAQPHRPRSRPSSPTR